jgi:hypothetical protein
MPLFPGHEHFYAMSDPLSKRPLRGLFNSQTDSLALTRGEFESPGEIVGIRWAMGGPIPSDLIWTTSGFPVIMHERVVNVLLDTKLTGWSTYQVEVLDKSGNPHPDYHGLAIRGRCHPIDLSRSAITLKKYPGGWYPHFLGHYFPEESWDASDLFMERPDISGHVTGRIFVSEEVHQAFLKAKIKNVCFERLSEESVDTNIYEIVQPHLLPPDFFSRVRAAYAEAGLVLPDQYNNAG